MAGARQHRAEEGAFACPTKGGAMRTRIALVAIIPIAVITVSTLTQAATAPVCRGGSRPRLPAATPRPQSSPPDRRSATGPDRWHTGPQASNALFAIGGARCSTWRGTTCRPASPDAGRRRRRRHAAAASTGPRDTVTPAQRAAWERVAMCEEGGRLDVRRTALQRRTGHHPGQLGRLRGRASSLPRVPRPPRTSRSWWPSASSPIRPDQYGCAGW